jgi:hypothetical protein
MYKYANIQDRRDEAVTKRLTDCKRRLHHLMVGALRGQPQALEDLISESRFDTNRFHYEIDLNQRHIEAISKEMNQVQSLVCGITSSPGLSTASKSEEIPMRVDSVLTTSFQEP